MKKLLAVLLLSCSLFANAAPTHVATSGANSATLTDEACAVKNVSNFQNRAAIIYGGKHFEACYGVFGDSGVVVFYLEDGRILVVPAGAFQELKGS